MIDAVDSMLIEWLRPLAAPTKVGVGMPRPATADEGVVLFLHGIADDRPPRGQGVPPLQVRLHYLVTVSAAQAAVRHRVLGELLFAAMEPATPGRPELEVVLTPPDPAFWSTLAVPPQPCFTLSVPLRKPRPQRRATMVRKPLVLETRSMIDLVGAVVGPGDTPLAGAEVLLPELDRWARCDHAGRFVLRAVPASARQREVIVHAKGLVRSFAPGELAADPLVIRFVPLDPEPN